MQDEVVSDRGLTLYALYRLYCGFRYEQFCHDAFYNFGFGLAVGWWSYSLIAEVHCTMSPYGCFWAQSRPKSPSGPIRAHKLFGIYCVISVVASPAVPLLWTGSWTSRWCCFCLFCWVLLWIHRERMLGADLRSK